MGHRYAFAFASATRGGTARRRCAGLRRLRRGHAEACARRATPRCRRSTISPRPAKGKPLDPAAFCSISAGLLRAESALIAYMEKNKDWCSFPDDAINNLKAGHAKNAGFSAKACSVADKIKKMKEQAAQGGGGRRPAGAAAARRPALTAKARRRARSPRRASREPRPAADAGFRASVRPARAPRPAGRLATAARALLAGRRRSRASRSHRGPEPLASRAFPVGAIAMRGAGSTYNDILDRKLDAGVERTRGRPLPSGRVSVRARGRPSWSRRRWSASRCCSPSTASRSGSGSPRWRSSPSIR